MSAAGDTRSRAREPYLPAVSGPGDAAFVLIAEVGLRDVLGDRHVKVVVFGPDGEVLAFRISVAAHSHESMTGWAVVGVEACYAAHKPAWAKCVVEAERAFFEPVVGDRVRGAVDDRRELKFFRL